MKVTLVEPFYGGSHKQWADEIMENLPFDFSLISLPPKWWMWRMYGGAVTLAKRCKELGQKQDLFIASSMMDVSTFLALCGQSQTPLLLYFHENQFAYPIRKVKEGKDEERAYRFINYTSALAATKVAFNSQYNYDTFFSGLEKMLKTFPDYRNMDTIDQIKKKSIVLPLGFDFTNRFPETVEKRTPEKVPVIVWNHRWEHDKNPKEFFETLEEVTSLGYKFRLIVAGHKYPKVPKEFDKAQQTFQEQIIHWGFAETDQYSKLLSEGDILPITSNQDFFGISVVEAIFAGCFPLLPRRLAYPEIIPPEDFPECYYDNLTDALTSLLKKFNSPQTETLETMKRLQNHLLKYEWKNLKDNYVKIFSDTANNK
ncbi:MAG: DUF3524 domain-containing protein [Leptospirales bacterium]